MHARIFISLAILCLALVAAACSKGDAPKEKPVLQINDYVIGEGEFKKRMAEEVRYYGDLNVNKDMISLFVDQLIRKELLIQEAIRLKIDRNEKFSRAIERFWENTLIRDVLEAKGEEIAKQTVVTEEELNQAYEQLKKANPSAPPMSEVAETLKKRLMDEKKTAALEEWINSLKNSAKITLSLDQAK